MVVCINIIVNGGCCDDLDVLMVVLVTNVVWCLRVIIMVGIIIVGLTMGRFFCPSL